MQPCISYYSATSHKIGLEALKTDVVDGDSCKNSLLHCCIQSDLDDTAIRLIIEAAKQQDTINFQNNISDSTPLHDAIKHYRYDLIPDLIKAGAKTQIEDEDGCTPIEQILGLDPKEKCNLLLAMSDAKDFDADASYDDTNLLDIAIAGEHQELATKLIQLEATVYEDSVLELLVLINDKEIEASLRKKDLGQDPLSRLIQTYETDHDKIKSVFKFLIDSGISLDKPDTEGNTPMRVAVDEEDADWILFLDEQGASLEGITKEEIAALNDPALDEIATKCSA